MHEFTSISVSSYDAASLADRLTEKSAAGWDVVAIVPAGTNITAYLSRDAGAAEPAPSWDTGSEDTASAPVDEIAEPASVVEATDEITKPTHIVDDVEEPAPAWEPEPVAEEPAPVEEPAPIEEPAGWAVAPEPASPTPASAEATPYLDPSSGSTSAQPDGAVESGYVGEPYLGSSTAGYDTGTSSDVTTEPSTDHDTAATTEPSNGYDTAATTDSGITESAEAVVETQATADVASSSVEEQSASPSAAPAGWYADPSGRYELRYWDGNQWTEHVSRAGQQYTDPPVA